MKDLLNNKMFKIFVGAILLIIFIIVIIAVIVSSGNKTVTNEKLQRAAITYYQKNPALLPKENYDSHTVSLSTLVASGYISSKNEGASCPSYVTVTNMNGTYTYTPFIKCNTSTSNPTLVSKLVENLTTTGSGLYNDNGKYIFKGENPNNYVKFADLTWRVIGLDESNNIKLIYSDVYTQYRAWDDRYNKDAPINTGIKGINVYMSSEKSRIKEYLDSFFANSTNIEKFTAERIARTTKFNTCIGKVDLQSNNTNICTETVNERISTLTVDDYVNASLDSLCSLNNSKNCQNYNFLHTNSWTINAYSNDTYSVYSINSRDGLKLLHAYIGNAIRPVIALKNDVIYVSGSGTLADPYMIG